MDIRPGVYSWLDRYIETHKSSGSPADPMIQTKREHSDHVAVNCRELAEELGWSPDDVITAELTGLLHDVGRFSQVSEFKTFHDGDSFDHGQRGRIVVEREGILSPIPDETRQAILDGIELHNRKTIPPDVNPCSLPFVKIVRDADKLDIYRVVLGYLKENSIRDRLSPVLKLDFEGPVNPDALDDVLRGETVTNGYVLSLADFHLMQISWVFDINYAPTGKRLRESGVIKRIAGLLPDNDERVKQAVDKVMAALVSVGCMREK